MYIRYREASSRRKKDPPCAVALVCDSIARPCVAVEVVFAPITR